jgi:hypothetical protein
MYVSNFCGDSFVSLDTRGADKERLIASLQCSLGKVSPRDISFAILEVHRTQPNLPERESPTIAISQHAAEALAGIIQCRNSS